MAKENVFTFSKCGGVVFLCGDWDVVFNMWMAEEFTERKKQNAIAKIKKLYQNVVFYFVGFDGVEY